MKWIGYSKCTWEPKDNFVDCEKALQTFKRKKPKMKNKSDFIGIKRPRLEPKEVVGERIIKKLDGSKKGYLICELKKFEDERAMFEYKDIQENYPNLLNQYIADSVRF